MVQNLCIFFTCTLFMVTCQGLPKERDVDTGALLTQVAALVTELKADIKDMKNEVKNLRRDADLQRKDMKKDMKNEDEKAWLTQSTYMDRIGKDEKNLTWPIIKRVWCHGKDSGCCTRDNPCYAGEGDCDNDDECAGALVCGRDNCANDGGFDASDDCCK